MSEVSLEQALEQLKLTQETLQAQQQEIEALKTKLCYLTDTEIVKAHAELAVNQKKLDNLEDKHRFTDKMLQNVSGETKKIQEQVSNTLEQELASTVNTVKQAQLEAENLLVGAVVSFAMSEVPQGWLECDGREVSREEYIRLFERIGMTFGKGNNFNTFNLPDLRNLFVRGWNRKETPASKRNFGSKQEDQIQDHFHNTNYKQIVTGINCTNDTKKGWKRKFICGLDTMDLRILSPTDENNSVRYGSETRPKNVALLYCIKY